MNFLKAYQYLFYKLYKFWEAASVPKFWSDAKAVLSIIILELFPFQSLMIYYETFINKDSYFGETYGDIILIFLLVCIPNYLFFFYKDRWKGIIYHFDKWPQKKNQIGGIIIWSIIIVIIIHFFLVISLL